MVKVQDTNPQAKAMEEAMRQIKKGVKLRSVHASKKEKVNPPANPIDDAIKRIEEGVELRPVSPAQNKNAAPLNENENLRSKANLRSIFINDPSEGCVNGNEDPQADESVDMSKFKEGIVKLRSVALPIRKNIDERDEDAIHDSGPTSLFNKLGTSIPFFASSSSTSLTFDSTDSENSTTKILGQHLASRRRHLDDKDAADDIIDGTSTLNSSQDLSFESTEDVTSSSSQIDSSNELENSAFQQRIPSFQQTAITVTSVTTKRTLNTRFDTQRLKEI